MSSVPCPDCGTLNSEFNLNCSGCGSELPETWTASRPAVRPVAPGNDAAGKQRGGAQIVAPREDSWVGRSVGRYQVLEWLGSGSMGSVYRAEDRGSGQSVALKTVRAPVAALLPRMRREIYALSRLRHPGIVPIFDSGSVEGMPWYAMELVEGILLRELVARHSQSPQRLCELLNLIHKVCSALAYLHGEGLVHGDLKPENILVRAASSQQRAENEQREPDQLDASGMPVLVDFGLVSRWPLARLGAASLGADEADEPSREALEVESTVAGTLAYMAPEQLVGEPLDARADLYALGCILYQLVTGRVPYPGRNVAAVVRGHLERTPVPPSELVEGVPPELEALVLQLLAKRRSQRPGHAGVVAAALRSLGANDSGFDDSLPPPRIYLYRPGFTGREGSLRQITSLLDRLEAGGGGLILVSGESGVGKTRLLLELARRAAERRIRVLAGECHSGVASSEQVLSADDDGSRLELLPPEGSEVHSRHDPKPLAARSSQLAASLESARARRGRSDRSPPSAAASGPLEALRRPLQAIADLCGERGLNETERLLGRRGKVLALYEPALAGLPGQAAYPEPAELPPEAARLRLFSALTETFAELAEGQRAASSEAPATRGGTASRSQVTARGPLLLLLDDLHWADELTVGFLEYWLRGGRFGVRRAAPVLIAGSYRTEEVAVQRAAPLQRLLDAAGSESIALGRFDAAAVARMAGDMLALDEPPAALTSYLMRQSEGNPFFVAEVLRTAVSEGLLYRDAAGRWQVAASGGDRVEQGYTSLPLPGSLRELVGRRLSGLTAGSSHLAEVAAVLGREVDGRLLAAVAGRPQAEAMEAVQELIARQVFEETDTARLRFLHDKIREVAYERIEPERRRKLHRAAAEALEAVPATTRDESLAAVGQHWEQAGMPEKARPWYLAGARGAAARYAHAEAERLYRATLALAPAPDAPAMAAHNELGFDILYRQGRAAEAIAEHEAALAAARQLGDRAAEGHTMRKLGIIYDAIGQTDKAKSLCAQALELARESGDRAAEAMALGSLSIILGVSRLEEAVSLCEQAIAIHRQLGNRGSEALQLGNLGTLYRKQGRFEQSRRLCEQSIALQRELRNRRSEGLQLTNLGVLVADEGRLEEAFALYSEGLAIAREVASRWDEGLALDNLAILHTVAGRHEQAHELYEQVLALRREIGDRRGEAITMSNLAYLCVQQGRPARAESLFEQALALHRETGDTRHEAITLGRCGGFHTGAGRWKQARAFLEQALALHRGIGSRPGEGITLRDLACLERKSGATELAEPLVGQAESIFQETGDRAELVLCLCERGHIMLARGRSSRECLDEARKLAAELHASADSDTGQAISRLARSLAAFEAGQPERSP